MNLTLAGLKAWPDIPQLANASGVGTYTTTVTLPSTTPSAILSLGQVTDTVKLTVNGTTCRSIRSAPRPTSGRT